MIVDTIIDNLNNTYHANLLLYLSKTNIDYTWYAEYINKVPVKVEEKTSEKNNTESETNGVYNKPWTKLNVIHKIIKIKEFVNNLKINSEQDKIKLREQLISLVKNKILTKKEKVKYNQENEKIISITNLKYENDTYIYCE
jgi:hypothetical protein